MGLATAFASTSLALTPAERALAEEGAESVKLNVLFIGAHPDDEAGTLATLGQWGEFHDMKVGVITATRGEGGGNAVGLEEGPDLGLIREAEERDAVGLAGIKHVYNLDALDFYYTASAPLSRQVWGGDELLGRIVRVVRATRPEVIVTMNPSAVEGNHGNHQQAAMYALEAYLQAGDPSAFPEHLEEGFAAWTPRRILRSGANGSGANGPDGVAGGYSPAITSDLVFGAWDGTPSQVHGKRWSQIKDEAIWTYVTQGWAERTGSPSDPAKIATTWMTLLHTRTPLADPTSGGEAALRGATLPIDGGLPLGTLLEVIPDRYEFVAEEPLAVRVSITAPTGQDLPAGTVALEVPAGWSSSGGQSMPALAAGRSHVLTFDVTVESSVDPGATARIVATLTAGSSTGTSSAPVRAAGALETSIEPLEEIREFRDWTERLDLRHLDALVPELFAIGQGRSRDLGIVVRNYSNRARAGRVEIRVPEGFSAEPPTFKTGTVPAGGTAEHTVVITNTNEGVPTANRAENGGSWPVELLTSVDGASAHRTATMNLVPSRVIVRAEPSPHIDGIRGENEYPGEPIPVETIWDGAGTKGGTTESVSAQSWLTFDDENLYVFLSVADDVRGTILPIDDNKRQRRTDSVEIYVDPRGTAANTAQTFIAGIMPSMGSMIGPPGVGRDRDNHQGIAEETAPGMEVAVTMADTADAYAGYDLEVKIPFDVLPDAIDPAHMGFNILINDSDTQNQVAQVRVGWSTFAGVRADPWRWGQVALDGLDDAGSDPKDAVLPSTAARSVDSPLSILQSAGDRVPLGGHSPTDPHLEITSVERKKDRITAILQSPVKGTATVLIWDGDSVLAELERTMPAGERRVNLRVPDLSAIIAEREVDVLASFEAKGKVSAAAQRLT
ncbi:PIG-L family deacetylase [Brachybacterium muris]|uniref:PIG-L family deacetylase n=1 Tax=Brachybacterium muris TaxID=219301 RepID=UPI0021A502C0|nr:PIG-L family deacetylase [Brachybacterium muris]MCT1996898.1 PIG-L family deacetylase [Brachybacterium muris]